jgi:hypothetical protein
VLVIILKFCKGFACTNAVVSLLFCRRSQGCSVVTLVPAQLAANHKLFSLGFLGFSKDTRVALDSKEFDAPCAPGSEVPPYNINIGQCSD